MKQRTRGPRKRQPSIFYPKLCGMALKVAAWMMAGFVQKILNTDEYEHHGRTF